MCVCRKCLWEVKPEFVWDVSASAWWAHTPLSFKRGGWLSIMDVGPPGVYLTAEWQLIFNVSYMLLTLTHTDQTGGCKFAVKLRGDLWAETGAQQDGDFAAGSGRPCYLATRAGWAMCLCWCCVCLRLRTSTGQRTTTAPSIMALFQLVTSSFS